MAATIPALTVRPALSWQGWRPRSPRKILRPSSRRLPLAPWGSTRARVWDQDAVVSGSQRLPFALIARTASEHGRTISAHGNSCGTPRSVAFNVQGFRVAVNNGTG